MNAVNGAIHVNKIDDGYVRLVVTRGVGTLGLDPNRCSNPQVIIIADAISLYPKELYEKGKKDGVIRGADETAAKTARVAALNTQVTKAYGEGILQSRDALLKGLNEVALTLTREAEITAHQAKARARTPS